MNLCDHIYDMCKPDEPSAYAQYGVQANPPSNTDLPMFVLFQEGEKIALNSTEISLDEGYLYLINYIFLTTTEINSYMQITPRINDALNLLYSSLSSSGNSVRDTSVSGSFTIAASDNTTLAFYLTYPETVNNIDISGAVSVTALNKLNQNKCL